MLMPTLELGTVKQHIGLVSMNSWNVRNVGRPHINVTEMWKTAASV